MTNRISQYFVMTIEESDALCGFIRQICPDEVPSENIRELLKKKWDEWAKQSTTEWESSGGEFWWAE